MIDSLAALQTLCFAGYVARAGTREATPFHAYFIVKSLLCLAFSCLSPDAASMLPNMPSSTLGFIRSNVVSRLNNAVSARGDDISSGERQSTSLISITIWQPGILCFYRGISCFGIFVEPSSASSEYLRWTCLHSGRLDLHGIKCIGFHTKSLNRSGKVWTSLCGHRTFLHRSQKSSIARNAMALWTVNSGGKHGGAV